MAAKAGRLLHEAEIQATAGAEGRVAHLFDVRSPLGWAIASPVGRTAGAGEKA